MALKKYAYYTKGNKLAIVQMDTTDISAEDYGSYKSPTEAVENGIEVEYSYSPFYRINTEDYVTATGWSSELITIQHTSDDSNNSTSNLRFVGDFSSIYTLESESNAVQEHKKWIYVEGSGSFDGYHILYHRGSVNAPNDTFLCTRTPYSGSEVTGKTIKIYYNVQYMYDEGFRLDLTRYQCNAIVYYLKAKLAEDMGDQEQREYFMRLFNKQMSKGAGSRKSGPHLIQGFGGMR